MKDEMTQWIEEDWETDDMTAAGELALVFLEYGNASPEWARQVRLLMAEYDMPKILSAMLTLMITAPSLLTTDCGGLHAELDRQIKEQADLYPSTRTPDRVMADINGMEI